MAKVKKVTKAKSGRKPLWDEKDMPSKLEAITGWALHGSLDEDICKMLGISHDTFYKWKREKPEFAEALKKGKEVANGELLNSAFKQSMGYYYMEQVPIKVKGVEFFGGVPIAVEQVEIVDVRKFAPANPTMSIFMMKNRMPNDYRDKQEVDVKSEVKNTYEYHVRQNINEDPETAAALKLLYKRQLASSIGTSVGDSSE